MNAYGLFEWLVLAVAVVASAAYAARTLAPDAWRNARKRIALWLIAAHRPAWMQRIGRAFAPAPRFVLGTAASREAASAAACGGCASSSGCASRGSPVAQ